MLRGARFICKPGDSLSKVLISRPGVRHCTASSQNKESVVIPPRVERGPTDILKALASTVGIDDTSYHYKYIDDPYLYPNTEGKKKILSLSLESGRKSARWIFKNNPGFFKNQLSDPPIEKFFVKPVTSVEANPTEETLLRAIEERNVLKAMEVYQALELLNYKVSEATKQCLLELTCFYNCEEAPSEGVEEKWFFDERKNKRNISIWLHQGFAERLYEKMDRSCSLANSAIIQGMLKYDEFAKARCIFEEARMKNIKLSVGVYNMFLSKIVEETGGKDTLSHIQKMLNDMSKEKIKPNVGTLNAILKSLLSFNSYAKVNFTLEIIKEFEKLGIKPSLGSYGCLFQILSYAPLLRRTYYDLSCEIMTHIENEKFEIVDAIDFKFFKNASTAFAYYHNDPDLSLRLLEMYLRNNNKKFIVNFVDERSFIGDIIPVIFKEKPLDVSMDIYRRLFFRTFDLSLKMFLMVISTIKKKQGSQYLPEIWKDLKEVYFQQNLVILTNILSLINDFSDESSLKILHSAALIYFSAMKSPKYDCFSENASVCSDVVITFVKNDDEKNISKFLGHLKERLNKPVNLNHQSVQLLFDYALSKKNIQLVVDCLRIADNTNHSKISEMAGECLPLLQGESKAWATELMSKGKKEEKSKTSE